ncbi:MAG TPA: phosphoribosylanthranilate isomerase [Candidatus Acidoferrales bacterium]|nr:phosphoribosylanthranilate isomerase [Candidatus Acidoferrales bacterium]
MVQVKICGITNRADAKAAVDAGAEALGFNFYPKSPRRISLSHAREIIRRLPDEVAAVGVFVNAPEKEVLRTARTVNLDALQLHGEESPKQVEHLARKYPVIKAFRVLPGFRVAQLKKYRSAAGFLLDGYDAKRRGGTGNRFDWRAARQARDYGAVIVAGGLTAENVAEAIRKTEPFAIDICSGVEKRPGKKDARKLKLLMAAVQSIQRKNPMSPRVKNGYKNYS